MVEFHHSMEKGHVRKESGITTKGRSKKEESILLLDNDKLKTSWSIKYWVIFKVYAPSLKYTSHILGLNSNY